MKSLPRLTIRVGLLFTLASTLAHAATAAAAASKSDFLPVMQPAIPEPSTYAALAGVGALGFALFRRLRRAK